MTRPIIYEELTTTSVKVEMSQLRDARAAGLNISDVLRRALDAELQVHGMRDTKRATEHGTRAKLRGVPVKLVEKALGFISNDPGKAEFWARAINRKCGTALNSDDLMAMVRRF